MDGVPSKMSGIHDGTIPRLLVQDTIASVGSIKASIRTNILSEPASDPDRVPVPVRRVGTVVTDNIHRMGC